MPIFTADLHVVEIIIEIGAGRRRHIRRRCPVLRLGLLICLLLFRLRLRLLLMRLDFVYLVKEYICLLHRHTTEIRNKVSAGGMASDVTFWNDHLISKSRVRAEGNSLTAAFLSVLPTERQHITAMTTPISSHIGHCLEAMRNSVINFILVSFL